MKNVLIIEDNEQNMYLISFILEKHGYNVLRACNGNDGLKIALAKKPDLIYSSVRGVFASSETSIDWARPGRD